MLVVTQDAEMKLLQTIRLHGRKGGGYRSLYFRFSNLSIPQDQWFQPFIEALEKIKDSHNLSSVYVCHDHDAFVLAQGVTYKSLDIIMGHMALCLDLSTAKNMASLFDLKMDATIVESLCQKKITNIQNIQKEYQKKQQQAEKEKSIQGSFERIDPLKILTLPSRKNNHADFQVMIVDDDRLSRTLIKGALDHEFFPVFANDGQSAVIDFPDVAPHIVFLDIHLPDISGYEVLRHMLLMDAEAHIIMLSGQRDSQNILKAIEMGAKGFIAKPFTRKKLIQYIEKSPYFNMDERVGSERF